MTQVNVSPDPQVISYRALRFMLGVIGIALPPTLVVGLVLFGDGELKGSLSAFYHTNMRDVFVGALCAMAVFLISYRGYTSNEVRITNVAGVCALGVAFCPTTPVGAATSMQQVVGRVHLGFAAALFVLLAVMSFEFAKVKSPLDTLARAHRTVHTVCGWLILFATAMCPLLGPITALQPHRPVLWAESLAIVAFGVSWLVKGIQVPGEPSVRLP